jgi:hypothetical protein
MQMSLERLYRLNRLSRWDFLLNESKRDNNMYGVARALVAPRHDASEHFTTGRWACHSYV